MRAETLGGIGEKDRPGRCPAGFAPGLRVGVRFLRRGEAGGLDRTAGEGEERGIGEVEDDRHRRRDGGGQDRLVVEGERVLGKGDAEGRAMRRKREYFRFRSRKLKV